MAQKDFFQGKFKHCSIVLLKWSYFYLFTEGNTLFLIIYFAQLVVAPALFLYDMKIKVQIRM